MTGMVAPTYYKVLATDGQSVHGGNCQWSLPDSNGPGEWMPKISNIAPCRRGYHIITLDQVPKWLITPALWIVEPRGAIIHDGNKSVCEEARLLRRVNQWNPRTIRLLAATWVEHIIPEWSQAYGPAAAPKLETLIDITRKYAEGEATAKELETARAAVRSLSSSLPSLPSMPSPSSLSLLLSSLPLLLSSSLSLLLSLSLLSSSLSLLSSLSTWQWFRDRWKELLVAPGDWSHVDWTEW